MMKIPVKYIMGPLLVGGLITSSCFTITAFYRLSEKQEKIRHSSPPHLATYQKAVRLIFASGY